MEVDIFEWFVTRNLDAIPEGVCMYWLRPYLYFLGGVNCFVGRVAKVKRLAVMSFGFP